MTAPNPRGQGLAVAGCNYVAQDQIWKDHVLHEQDAAKSWPANWNFLTTRFEDLMKDDMPKQERKKIQLPPHMTVKPATPISERVTVHPSTRDVPKTTSDMIGWRSTDKKLALEKYGKYAKGKGGLIKQLKWPAEGVN